MSDTESTIYDSTNSEIDENIEYYVNYDSESSNSNSNDVVINENNNNSTYNSYHYDNANNDNYDDSYDEDASDDSELDIMAIQEIADYMDDYPVSAEHDKYILGWTNPCEVSNHLLVCESINIEIFYKHTYKNIVDYFYNYSYIEPDNYPRLDIIKVQVTQDGEYQLSTAIVKTYWICIIQRFWKKIYRERMRVLSLRKNLNTMRTIELTGKYPKQCCYLPSIRGLMSNVQNVPN
jgi:hypothetical protein